MDDEGVPGAPRQDQLLEEASLWFARMRGPDADRFRPMFDAWLALGPDHLGAFNRAGEIFALGKFLAETPDTQTIDTRNRIDPWIGRQALVVVGCLALLLGAGAWLGRDRIAVQFGGRSQVASAAQQGIAGERFSADATAQRDVTLIDGSRVRLEPGSILAVHYQDRRRELRLESGRARFDVAHEARPFVVLAGSGSVTARGTIFDVILERGNEVTVKLLRGAVDVARPTTTASAGVKEPIVTRLAPGETLSFGAAPARALASAATAIAPTGPAPLHRAGEAREFAMTPLSDIVAQANQNNGVTIRLADPAIGELKVSGRFRVDDAAQLAERLGALLNLKVDQVSDAEILLRAR